MIQNDTLSINHQGKPVARGQNLMKRRRRNMIKTIGFRPLKAEILIIDELVTGSDVLFSTTDAFVNSLAVFLADIAKVVTETRHCLSIYPRFFPFPWRICV
jgi:hypothetical protein